MRIALLSTLGTAAAALSLTSAAYAGPTVSADLDLGSSVRQDLVVGAPRRPIAGPDPYADYPPLYVVGFRIRAGWRFQLGTVFLTPEIGGGYDVELPVKICLSDPSAPTVGLCEPMGRGVPRVFGGARAGLSFAVGPSVWFEPGIYGHVGYARYLGGPANIVMNDDGVANDIGLSLDLRLIGRLVLGAHLGYDVITGWQSLAIAGSSSQTITLADRWLGYGVHAGVLFW